MENRLLRRVTVPGTDLDVPYAVCGTMMFGKRADDLILCVECRDTRGTRNTQQNAPSYTLSIDSYVT